MSRCSFCKKPIKPGRGITYVEISGKISYLCSSKCKKHFKSGRDPLRLNWVIKRKEEQ